MVYSTYQLEKNYDESPYTDARSLFLHCCQHMTILGTVIVSSKFIRRVIDAIPVDKEKNLGMWQPVAIFDYIADKPFTAHLLIGDIFWDNAYATATSFWNKNGKALWQWGQRWYEMITALPSVYEDAKEEVLRVEFFDFHPFRRKELIIMRMSDSLSFNKVRKYEQFLKFTSTVPLAEIYAVSIVPKFICRLLVNQPNTFMSRALKGFFKLAKLLFRLLVPAEHTMQAR